MLRMDPILRNFLATCGALLLVVGTGAYWYNHMAAPTENGVASTTTHTLSDGTVVTIPAGSSVSELPPEQTAPTAPLYRTPIAYAASVSADVRTAVEQNRAHNIGLLDQDKKNFSAWMDLAVLYKIGGDYRGAETIWLYVTKAWPQSPIAFHNLGDLYENFLKDAAKAKLYYNLAAKLGTN